MTILDMAYMNSATTGTGTLQLGSAQSGYQTFAAAGAANNGVYSYGIIDAGTTWEIGQGTYITNSSGNFWARTTINYSTSAGSPINCTGAEVIYLTTLQKDYENINISGALTVNVGSLIANIGGSVGANNQTLSSNGTNIIYVYQNPPPIGGRLTLTTGTPVLRANTTNQSTIFFTPFSLDGSASVVNIYDGSAFASLLFSETSLVLDATNVVNAGIYDVFGWNNNGTLVIGYGPAWTSNTARSAAISTINGIWVANASITLRSNSSTTNTISAHLATYLGTFFATSAGNTGMKFYGSNNNGGSAILGLYNAYNQVLNVATEQNSNNSSYGYSSTTWRKLNGGANANITYIDGLGLSSPSAIYTMVLGASGDSSDCLIGIGFNWASGAPTNFIGTDSVTIPTTISARFQPALGLNVIQSLEASTAASVSTFNNNIGAGKTTMDAEIMM